jgi:HTH-type transcriptional regulator/antitoxin HipB
MNEIIEQLKKARREKNINQADLGKKLGLPQSHISKIESGETDSRLSTLADMARLLDLELMLIPREMLPVIRSILRGDSDDEPLWKPDE